MKSKPLVSVIIPTYNYAGLISQAIDSVLESEFPVDQLEIIVVDDGSTDDTADRVKVYGDQVTYIYQANLGKAEGTRVAIGQAQGKYIFNLDADDFFLPHKIRQVVDIFESDPEIVHVAHPAKCWSVDTDTSIVENIPSEILGRKIAGKELLSYFFRKNILFGGGSTFAARADVLNRFVIPRDVDMFIDEYLVMLANCQEGYAYFIEDALSVWRIHGRNFSAHKVQTDQIKVRQRANRNLASMDAVLKHLPELGVDEAICRVYRLKTLAFALAIKEQFHEKNLRDIFNFCQVLLRESTFFGVRAVEIIRNYKLLNRTLPNSLILRMKRKYQQI
jgi:glycosyltransferase involved in cell wall biosynthesis